MHSNIKLRVHLYLYMCAQYVTHTSHNYMHLCRHTGAKTFAHKCMKQHKSVPVSLQQLVQLLTTTIHHHVIHFLRRID